MNRKLNLVLLVVLLMTTVFAHADTIYANQYATITVTSSSIDLVMNSGYTLKIQDGNDFNINCTGCSNLSWGDMTLDYGGNLVGPVDYTLNTGANVGSGVGVFDFNFTQIGTSFFQGQGITSVDSLHLAYTGTINFQDFAIHVCADSGTNCSPNTFFSEVPPTSAVPEPGSMAMLGTGLVGLAGVIRRKFLKT